MAKIDMSEKEKHAGGRPVKYSSVDEVQGIIDEYFETDAYVGEGDLRMYAPTMSGLAYALDLSRQGLLDYANKEEFYDTIKKARQRVEIALEQRLAGQAPAGTIFNLKNNFGWKDKQELEHSGSIDMSSKTDEELRKIRDGS